MRIVCWQLYTFLRDNLQRIWGIVTAVVTTISEIAHGVLQSAGEMVEDALASLIPIAISLLANLLGLGAMSARVRDIIEGIREQVRTAIRNLIRKVKGLFTGGGTGEEGDTFADDESAVADGEIGEHVSFSAGDESHEIWVEALDGGARLMMASGTPRSIETWLDELAIRGADLKQTDEQRGAEAETKIDVARAAQEEAAAEAARVAASVAGSQSASPERDASAAVDDSALKVMERAVSAKLREVLEILGVSPAEQVLIIYAKQLAMVDSAGLPTLEEALQNEAHASTYAAWADWQQIRANLPASSPDVREVLAKPINKEHTFGRTAHVAQAVPAATRARDRHNADKQASVPGFVPKAFDVETTLRAAKALINISYKPYTADGRDTKARFGEQLWGDLGARDRATGELEESLYAHFSQIKREHDAFVPQFLVGYDDTGFPTIKYTYREYSDVLYEVQLNENRTVASISGQNLRLSATVGELGGRGKTDRSIGFVSGLWLNASHLVADELFGSGILAATNLITTSAYYNQVTMRSAEIKIRDFIKSLAGTEAIPLADLRFNLTVTPKWGGPLVNGGVLSRLSSEVMAKFPPGEDELKAAFRKEWASGMLAILAIRMANPSFKRCMGVDYLVEVLIDGREVPESLTCTLHEDIYLGLDDEKLRELLNR